MRTYNVGILGFGFIGKVHAYAHLTMPLYYPQSDFRTRITHIGTSGMATAKKGCTLIQAKVPVTDYLEITENPGIDIVHICTPNHLHKDMLLSALKNNKHIYCDKPLVANAAEAAQIKEALSGYTGTAQMTFQCRFFPATLRAVQLVREGFLGDVHDFRASYLHSGSATPETPLKWKLSAKYGGGVIADLGAHVFDLIQALLGDYDRLIAASRIAYSQRPSADDPDRMEHVEAEDSVNIIAHMKNGALGAIEASKTATGTEDELRFELHGTTGAIRFNSMQPHHLQVYDAGISDKPFGGRRGWTFVDCGQRYPESNFPGPKFSIGWMRAHVASLFSFLDNVSKGWAGEPGFDQGIYVQHVIERVRESARLSEWVTL
ncbi:MAG: Gfo/Idh/MocA family oxidoreductase [Deltaproteobacteria bacterium]|jgi:predicted dehydrogenase|nr:Gfo/Idh/MocA family oxidoreductase [Deltaproteobacteria bacterium]